MSGFYGISPRVWPGVSRHNEPSQPDPYSRSSPAYRQRMRETVTDIGNGLSRVDLGEPVTRVAGAPQPIDTDDAYGEPEEEPQVSEVPDAPTPTIASVLRATSLTEFKPGLGRG